MCKPGCPTPLEGMPGKGCGGAGIHLSQGSPTLLPALGHRWDIARVVGKTALDMPFLCLCLSSSPSLLIALPHTTLCFSHAASHPLPSPPSSSLGRLP